MILIIILILLLFILLLKKNPLIEGLNTFNGRMAIDDQYFYDKVFDDVFYYENDPDNPDSGCITCKQECTGKCVEYGLTNSCYCFPY